MDKPTILAQIESIAASDGGKAPGRAKFERITGIKMSDWYPHHWLRWGDALLEAGLAPNELMKATSDETIIAKYIELSRELGRLPLDGEMRLREKSDPTFPSHSTIARLGGKRRLVAKVLEYCAGKAEFSDIEAVCKSASLPTTSKDESVHAPVQGYVYLMRSGRRYKIGFTSSPSRPSPRGPSRSAGPDRPYPFNRNRRPERHRGLLASSLCGQTNPRYRVFQS